jgi:hypothetical protein
MLRQRKQKGTAKRYIRFKGIVRDAEILGVSRIHLYRVLTGERRSPLLARYRDLQRSKEAR